VIEKLGQNCFPVKVVTLGSVKKGYKIVNVQVTPQNVAIHDSDSMVKSISSLKAFVDVNGADRDIVLKCYCQVYNKNGTEIVQLNRRLSVSVKVEIAKQVPIVPIVHGTPLGGYIDSKRIITPDMALITGDPKIIDGIEELKTESINIQNATQTVSKICFVDLPVGVRLIDTPSNVSVNIKIEPEVSKRFNYTSDNITILNANNGIFKYNILTKNVGVMVEGASSELSNISQKELNPSIDVKGLKEGKHKIGLKVVLPAIIRLANQIDVLVEITRK